MGSTTNLMGKFKLAKKGFTVILMEDHFI